MAKRSGKRNYFGEEATTGINPPKRHHPELDQIEGSSSSTLSSSQSSGSGTTKMRKIKKTKGKKEILVNRKAKKAREGRREQRKFMHGGIEVPWVGREIEIVRLVHNRVMVVVAVAVVIVLVAVLVAIVLAVRSSS